MKRKHTKTFTTRPPAIALDIRLSLVDDGSEVGVGGSRCSKGSCQTHRAT